MLTDYPGISSTWQEYQSYPSYPYNTDQQFGLITASEVMTFHLITLEKLVNLKLDNPKLGTIY